MPDHDPLNSICTFLLISVPATIMVPPMNTTVVSPNPAVFTCEADGVSTPVITWWRRESSNNLTQLSSDGTIVTISDRNLTSRMVQSNLTILQSQPVDAAEYVCRATNELRSDAASAVLTVHGMCSDMLHPTFIHVYASRVLICKVLKGAWLHLHIVYVSHRYIVKY